MRGLSAASSGGGSTRSVARSGGVLQRLQVFAEMIKWEHSVFALPFAYMGALLAVRGAWPTWAQVGWITLAMVAGRTLAFVLNRWIDREIDARNPRTADRALPRGLLGSADMALYGIASLALFMLAVFNLAEIVRWLWPIVIAVFVVYPYTKRFTWLCHVWLGASLGLAPVGAWVAITGRLDPEPWLLFGAVTTWVAGFDILYATQDVEVDKREGLRSIPARFGIASALRVTAVLHGSSLVFFLATGSVLGLGAVYYVGVAATGLLLAYENRLVRPDDLSRLNAAFFTMNGVVSVVTFAFTFADKVARLRII